MLLLKILAVGLTILVAAIAMNACATKLSLKTWYAFLAKPKDTNIASYLWLFVVYPFGLGLAAYAVFVLMF